MSKLTEEFEKIRYLDEKLSDAENEQREKRRKELLKEMSDDEFKEVIKRTGSPQAKIAYKKFVKKSEQR